MNRSPTTRDIPASEVEEGMTVYPLGVMANCSPSGERVARVFLDHPNLVNIGGHGRHRWAWTLGEADLVRVATDSTTGDPVITASWTERVLRRITGYLAHRHTGDQS